MGVKVTNNAFGTLSAGINTTDTTITLDSGQGARFPTLGAGDYFYGTIVDTSNNIEIVKVTARSTDSMTVTRAQDNTTATAFAIGDRFELRPVAALFEDIIGGAEVVNDTSPTLGGDLDADGNDITDVGQLAIGNTSPLSGTKIAIGPNVISTAHPSMSISDTTNGASLTLRGLSPTIYFDKTGTGKGRILTDAAGLSVYDGTLDAVGDVMFSVDSNSDFKFDSGYGSATVAYGVRAWLHVNTSNSSIYDSGGISSVTRNGTGDVTVNFSFTFPDTNYIIVAESFDGGGQNDFREVNSSFTSPGKTTTQHRMYMLAATTGGWNPIADDTAHLMLIAVR
jgi:hypothetical protein